MALTAAERAAARAAWLARVRTEIERRNARLTTGDVDYRSMLLDELTTMGERLRSAPDYVEPTEAEQRRNVRWVESWLRQRGYLSG